MVRPLFWRDAPEERKILSRLGMEPIEVMWQAVVHRGLPVCPPERLALSVGNRDQGHFDKLVVHGDEVGQIQPSMQRGDDRDFAAAPERKSQKIQMRMDNVELAGEAKSPLQQKGKRRVAIYLPVPVAQTKRLRADRLETSGCPGVATGEQRHVVPQPDQFFG